MKDKNIRAKDAAALAVKEDIGPKEVEKLIPVYANELPRRAWIKRFRDALPETHRAKFAELSIRRSLKKTEAV